MSNNHPINTWHVCISGFLQREGKMNGIVQLWSDLHFEHAGSNTRVELREWCGNWGNIAEWIWRMRPVEPPKINIYGYSWGGFSATLLSRQLAKRGLHVDNLVLSDAVYRHRYLFGQWRALVPWMKIKIPSNVKNVTWFRQWGNLPRGHTLVAEDPNSTIIRNPFEVRDGTTHQYMDDYRPFHDEAKKKAGELG